MRFVLVDRILRLTPGVEITASRRIAHDEDYFQDHFPGFPVVPGVLLTEMMAQTAGKCLLAERRSRGIPILAKILSASFRQWVQPGDEVTMEASVQANDERFATTECRASVSGKTVAQARLMFSFVAAERFAADWRDPVLESFLAQTSP